MKLLKIVVTEEDIEAGRKFSSTLCPVGRAIHREIGHEDYQVGSKTLYIEGRSRKSSAKIRQFILDFDDGKKVKPFKVYIKPPK
jgi:hypothetical protein